MLPQDTRTKVGQVSAKGNNTLQAAV